MNSMGAASNWSFGFSDFLEKDVNPMGAASNWSFGFSDFLKKDVGSLWAEGAASKKSLNPKLTMVARS